MRPFYFIQNLAKKHRITIFSLIEEESEKDGLKYFDLTNIKIRTVRLPKWRSYLQCSWGLFEEMPLENFYYNSRQMRMALEEELSENNYDMIFCHLIRMAYYVVNFKNIPKVLDMSDALSLRYALSSKFRKGPFKIIESMESARLKNYEPEISKKFDRVTVASSIDKIYLEGLGVNNVEVIENGVSADELEAGNSDIRKNKIVFFANMRAFPNQDAANYFYRDIFPLIKKEFKDVKFVIVGADIPPSILSMRRDSSVEVYEDVRNIKEFVEDAYLSIAPMRIAVGVQNKILQSMAFRVPVVATTLGLGGIRAVPGKDILIGDDSAEFAKKVIMLIRSPKIREDIARNGYDLVNKHYPWGALSSVLEKRLLEIAGDKER